MAGLFRHPKRRIRKLIKDGEYLEAIRYGKDVESEHAGDHDFMFIMGSVYFIVEDAKRALPYFERALELDDTDVETLTLKTNVHLALQQKAEAIGCCKRITELQPGNTEARDLLAELEGL